MTMRSKNIWLKTGQNVMKKLYFRLVTTVLKASGISDTKEQKRFATSLKPNFKMMVPISYIAVEDPMKAFSQLLYGSTPSTLRQNTALPLSKSYSAHQKYSRIRNRSLPSRIA